MPHQLIVVTSSGALPSGLVVPEDFEARVIDPASVRTACGRGRDVIILGDGVDAIAIRALAPKATLVAWSDDDIAADVVVRPSAGTHELCRVLRYVSGQAMRRSERFTCATKALLTDPTGTRELEIVEVCEDGVRARPAPLHVVTGATLAIGGHVEVRVEEHRRTGDEVVLVLREATLEQRAALRALALRGPRARLRVVKPVPQPTRRMIGSSPAMLRAIETLERVAPTDVTALVLGETGTGKELAARIVHESSPRAKGPLVAVNCAALPENLVESELFGHEPGAFTGALKRRCGRIEQAQNGTLFLDEIGDLPLAAQAKLLRALQERVIERVGGTEPIRVDFRLVSATNRDLAADIASRTFRRDLFYRLSVVTVRLPALRERTGDIAILARHFLDVAMGKLGRRGVRLSDHALARMAAYPWPGNVRELENVCTRLVALSNDAILGPEHLGLVFDQDLPHSPLPTTDLRDILDFCEREIVRRMLDRHGGNRTRTAGVLGISRQALQQKIARFATGDATDPL